MLVTLLLYFDIVCCVQVGICLGLDIWNCAAFEIMCGQLGFNNCNEFNTFHSLYPKCEFFILKEPQKKVEKATSKWA